MPQSKPPSISVSWQETAHWKELFPKPLQGGTEGCLVLSRNHLMEHEEKIQEVLSQFVNSHEQTYEEFLSSFTHLSRRDKDLSDWKSAGLSLENIGPASRLAGKGEMLDFKGVSVGLSSSSTPQLPEEDQIILDAGQRVGGFNRDDPPLGGMVKVDNFFDANTFEEDEHLTPVIGSRLLPGEAEEDVRSYVPSFTRRTQLPIHTLSTICTPNLETEEIQSDDVEPFSLDQDFDYDRVVLTPKFPTSEMKAMTGLTVQVGPGTVD